MRLLVVTPDFYDPDWLEYSKNKTGFGMMVSAIVKELSRSNEVKVFTKTLSNGGFLGNATVEKHTKTDILLNASIKDWFDGIHAFFKYKQSLKKRIKYFVYYLNKGALRKTLKDYNPKFVMIHGISFATLPLIEVCEQLSVRFSVTLHGCVGINESINLANHEKQLEKNFLIYAEKNKIPVTTISEGTKRQLCNSYGIQDDSFIRVIRNGVAINNISKEYDIYKKHNIPNNNKVILVVGSIYSIKNQYQIIRSFNRISKRIRDHLTVCFLGQICDEGEFLELIRQSEFRDNFRYCGFVSHDEIGNYYKRASINLIVSLTEGFGLSSIEGFQYGVPTLMYSDLDAVPDIYNENAVFLVNKRTDECLAKSIEFALEFQWNQELIKQYARSFSLDSVILNYLNLFEELLQ